MRKRLSLIIFSSLALLFLSFFWNWGKQIPDAPAVSASVPGGYYQESFLLELTAPEEGHIYYTLDGSRPSADTALYENGILISDRSSEPNHYNAIQNVVTDWLDYTPDPAPVAKGTVVRAVFVNRWGKESEIFTQTYFVGLEPPENGYTLSLIFEEDDVFGADGIYVTGADYDFWYLSGQIGSAPEVNFGVKTKVPAIMELMDPSGDLLLQSAAMRIQGSSAVIYPKKRLALYAETGFSPANIFSRQLFPNVDTHSVMLKDSIPDLIVSELVADRSVSLQKNIPVRVFLNGEFWYDTYILERFDKQYFQSYYDVDDIILVKDGQQEQTTDRQLRTYYDDFMDWVEETDFSQPENWTQLQNRMDVQSYIDFFCINHYLCNLDWSQVANCTLWCSTADTDTGYQDMRWRWCIYDVDNLPDAAQHFGYDQIAQVDTFTARTPWINSQTNEQSLYLALRANPDFCQQFVLSFMDLVNNNFTYAKTSAALNKYTNNDSHGWLYAFFRDRSEAVIQHLANEFQLTGTLETVSLSCADPNMGSITVNTSQIDLTNGVWQGAYFSDYPITMTATPCEGYEFLGWKGDVQSSSQSITVSLDSSITVEAVFAKKK